MPAADLEGAETVHPAHIKKHSINSCRFDVVDYPAPLAELDENSPKPGFRIVVAVGFGVKKWPEQPFVTISTKNNNSGL